MNPSYLWARALKKSRPSAIRDSRIDRTSKIESGSTVVNCVIQRHSFCGYDCSLIHCDIGAFCSIATRVSIGGIAHPMHYVSTSPAFLSHRDSIRTKFAHHEYLPAVRTSIGNDVWIGCNVTILKGVNIGKGAVIAAGSVVIKNVEPYSIVAGVPAKFIKYRFLPEEIKEHERILNL